MRFIFALIAFAATFPGFTQSFTQYNFPTDHILSDIEMVTPTVGYAGGVDGIFKTVDGAQSWELLPSFIDSGDISKGYYFLNFNNIHLKFFNELEGIAFGWHSHNYELIMRTTDGGMSWKVQHFAMPDVPNYVFHYLNDIHVWGGGKMVIAGNNGRLLWSVDNGINWTATSVGVDDQDLVSVQFLTETAGFAANDDRLFKTIDGGKTWSQSNIPLASINDMHFFDESNGVAVGTNGYILKTSDGGKTWTRAAMKAEASLYHVHFIDSEIGFASGYNGLIYKSGDGGASWLKIHQSSNTFVESTILSESQIYFVNSAGHVVVSSNGGVPVVEEPVISSIDKNAGVIGNEVIITGHHLDFVVSVKYNGVAADFTLLNGTLKTVVPRGASTGLIELVWPNGSIFSQSEFVVSKVPILYWDFRLYYRSDNPLIIQGENLQHVTTLTLNDVIFPFVILNSKEISISLPNDYPNIEPTLKITSPFGATSMTLNFAPAPKISNNYLSYGHPGKVFILEGENFADVLEVKFGSVPAANFITLASWKIQCEVPNISMPLSGRISVRTKAGIAYTSLDFNIIPAPIIDDVTPLKLKAGEELKITGKFLPESAFLGKVLINGYPVSSFGGMRFVDGNSLFVTLPEGVYSSPITISVTNNGGATTTTSFPVIVDGKLPYHIRSVSPARHGGDRFMSVIGFYPYLDSVTINGKKIRYDRYYEQISIPPDANLPFGKLILYYNGGQSITWPEDVGKTLEKPLTPLIADPEPQRASMGQRVSVRLINAADVLSLELNGKAIPFDPIHAAGNVESLSFTVTEDMTSGLLTLRTKDGIATARTPLIIDNSNASPVIYQTYFFHTSDTMVMVVGHNFERVNAVRLDDMSLEFNVVSADTLIARLPSGLEEQYFVWYHLFVESPNGTARVFSGTYQYPMRRIKAVIPSMAPPGSVVKVILHPKKEYINYSPIDFSTLYFNKEAVHQKSELNDTTWLAEVPRTGNINGRLGMRTYSVLMYSDVTFQATQDQYCEAIGARDVQSVNKIIFHGTSYPVGTKRYEDHTSDVIEVTSGQKFHAGITMPYGQSVKLYIDWDGDKKFNEEPIAMSGNFDYVADSTIFALIQVPPSARTGVTRMRFVVGYSSEMDACGLKQYQDSKVIDFSIKVSPVTNTFKVVDLYPRVGTAGTIVTLVGDNLSSLTQVTLNGLTIPIVQKNDVSAELEIPAGAVSGLFNFQTETGSLAYPRTFTIDPTIEPPVSGKSNFNAVYRTTINGIDVPFYYSYYEGTYYPEEGDWVEGHKFYRVTPVFQDNQQSGEVCYYTPGGKYCSPDRVLFSPQVNEFPIHNVVAGEKTIFTGMNLADITSVTLDDVDIPFETISDNSFSIVLPDDLYEGSHTLKVSVNYYSVSGELFYDDGVEQECNPKRLWKQGGEITNVQFEQIKNSSGKNATGGYSDYSSMVTSVKQYHNHYIPVTLKNFSAEGKSLGVEVFISKRDSVLFHWEDEAFAGYHQEQLFFNPGEEKVVHCYFHVPREILPGENADVYFVVTDLWFQGCDPNVSEVERYTLYVSEPEEESLSITSASSEVVKPGETIIIYGSMLDNADVLKVNGVSTEFEVISSTTIQLTIPGTATTGKVAVMSSKGSAESPFILTILHQPQVNSISPAFGSEGTEVTVKGSGFNQVISISLGEIPVKNYSLISDSELRLVIPQGSTNTLRFAVLAYPEAVSETFYYCDGLTANLYCRIDQTITFEDIGHVELLMNEILLDASASSGLQVQFTSSNPEVASVSGKYLILHSQGSVVITATQIGNSEYNAADPVRQVLIVEGSPQSITFQPIDDVLISQLPLTMDATATSGLAVSFVSPDNVTITGNTLTATAPGRVMVLAVQEGDKYYNKATPQERFFCMLPDRPVIDVTEPQSGQFILVSSNESGNQWYFNGQAIEDQTGKSIEVREAGVYSVQTTADDCKSEMSQSVTVIVTSIEEHIKPRIFPNPVLDEVTVTFRGPRSAVRIISMLGETMLIKPANDEDEVVLNLSMLGPGTYIVEVIHNNKVVAHEKLIKL